MEQKKKRIVSCLAMMLVVVSQFNGTSTPKGSHSAKTGDNAIMIATSIQVAMYSLSTALCESYSLSGQVWTKMSAKTWYPGYATGRLLSSTPVWPWTSDLKLIDALVKDMQRLPVHLFRATWQHRQIGLSIASLPTRSRSACLVMDFA